VVGITTGSRGEVSGKHAVTREEDNLKSKIIKVSGGDGLSLN
jgi:hypothetical protein